MREEENKWCKKDRKEREGKEEKGRCPLSPTVQSAYTPLSDYSNEIVDGE